MERTARARDCAFGEIFGLNGWHNAVSKEAYPDEKTNRRRREQPKERNGPEQHATGIDRGNAAELSASSVSKILKPEEGKKRHQAERKGSGRQEHDEAPRFPHFFEHKRGSSNFQQRIVTHTARQTRYSAC